MSFVSYAANLRNKYTPGIGNAPAIDTTQTQTSTPNFGTTFNVPSNLFPFTKSSSGSHSAGSSHSGINWDTPFAKSILPSLTATAQGLPGLTENMGQTLQDQYSSLMRQAMGPGNFQDTLNQLAGRGILNSSITENALANVSRGIAQDIANQAFQSQIAQQQAQMQVPSILAKIMALGQESQSRNSGGGSGSSYQANPLAPYELMLKALTY